MIKKVICFMVMMSMATTIVHAKTNEVTMLKNGITLIENRRDYTDTIAVAIMIKGGLYLEDNKTNGIGYLTSRVALKSNKILESSEFYGASISSSPTPYSTDITFSAPTEVFAKLLPDLEQFLISPEFKNDIFKREQRAVIDEITANKDDPNTIAYERFSEIANDGTPYAMTTEGKIENVEKFTLENLKNFNKHLFEDSQMIVSVTGNFDDKIIKSITDILLKVKTAGKFDYSNPIIINLTDDNKSVKQPAKRPAKFESKRVEEVDTRIKQAKMFIWLVAPSADDPLYTATVVMSDILGGGMSSRYFTEIRKNLGFAYSVSSSYPTRIGRSGFMIYAGLEYDNIAKAIESLDEINSNLAKTLTDAEVEKGKNSVLGSLLIQQQTNTAIARKTAFYELIGLGATYYDKSIESIKALTKKDILKASEILNKDRVIYILKPSK